LICSLLPIDSQALLASAISEWLSSAWAIVLMVLGFSLVIFVHELGHFVMAKLAGVRVDKFAIGFGKELFGRTWGETRYAVNFLPLGGYVKMLGQEDFEIDPSGEWKVKDDPRSFTNKSVGKRMLIVSSGVMMNLVFAALAFMVVFMVGLTTVPPKVGHILPGSPAHRAGLMSGDDILEINHSKMDDFSDVMRAIMLSDTDRPIELKLERQDRQGPFTVHIEPEWSEQDKVRKIGIGKPMTLQVGAVDLVNETTAGREDRLRYGDTIVEVAGVKVHDPLEVEQLITEKRGGYVEVVVNRPVDPGNLEGPTQRMTCYHRAQMLIVSTSGGIGHQHVLGLQPRPLLLQVTSGGPAGRAGIREGDIIVKWGDHRNPTTSECKQMLLAKDERGRYVHAGRNLEIVVRRIGMSKEIGTGPDAPTGTVLSYGVLKPLLEQRDELSVAAQKDYAATRKRILAILGEQTGDKVLLEEVEKDLSKAAGSAGGLVRWLANLDRESYIIRPEAKGVWKAGPPVVGVGFGTLETDRLVVSKVVEEGSDGKPTPASSLNLPRGSLITHVNTTQVKTWIDLVEALRANAGTQVSITYTHDGVVGQGKMNVPQTLKAALDLPPGADVISIAGEKRARFKREGQTLPVSLPYWAAAREILKANQGRTVPVVYRYRGEEISTDPNGQPLTYTVSADNADPWLMRIMYTPMLVHFPERITLQKTSPLAAMWMGFKKTVNFIVTVYKMMEHMIITQKVGVEHVSGPVGILRIGHTVAQTGVINLLYFLAIISANLAVINFLPLPIVDGGLMVFLLLEKIRGRPVSIKMQVVTQIIGLALIIGIFVFVTFLDVSKWVGEG
jgi:membrane-associated protease RseP (regulator of RpoE activity)